MSCTAFSRCRACWDCSSIWTQPASCSPVRQIRTCGWPQQEQCQPVPAQLEKCCNCHEFAGNAHKGRAQRQSDDLSCPDRLPSTRMRGEERTDDPERVLRHPLCWNRTKSRRWRPRLGDRVVLRGERLRSANQGQVGIRRPPHKRQTPRHAPIRLPHAGFVPQLGWPCVVLVRFCAESAFRSSVSRRQRRISAETRKFGHHPHLQKNPQALGVKFYSPAWLIMGSHAAGTLAMCQSPNFTSPPRRQ